MRFLKKVSYKDIIGKKDGNQFHYYDNVADKYKEFELYLTQNDLDDLLQHENTLNMLTTNLKDHGAVIKAIHCPESWSITCNEKDGEKSSNYLSLCEVINDTENSRELKEFFDDLFIVYTYSKRNVFEITNAMYRVTDKTKIGKRVVTYNCIKEIPAYYCNEINNVSGKIVRLRYLQDVADLKEKSYVFALVKDGMIGQIKCEDKSDSNICLLSVLNLKEDRTNKTEAYCLRYISDQLL